MNRRVLGLFWAFAALQLALLCGMVINKQSILYYGKTIVLKT